MKADRAWNDDGARKQLLQFFDAWGAADEASVTARRKLSSLLFSLREIRHNSRDHDFFGPE